VSSIAQIVQHFTSIFAAPVGGDVTVRGFWLIVVVLGLAWAAPAAAQPRGDAGAVRAAQRLLEDAGGREAWSRRIFEVEERAYLRSGEVAELRIVRDFRRRSRLIKRRTPSQVFREWVAPDGGWVERDGVRTPMTASELAAELYGARQEPYMIYHMLATSPEQLRVALRDEGASLFVYDSDERLLSWFRLAANGSLRGWGNFFDGAINEHYYGPIVDMGDAHLPRWGAAANGGFRFEYVSGRLRDYALVEPSR
jgi:hypothetical protein